MTTVATILGRGLLSARPAAGSSGLPTGSVYYATDTQTYYQYDGTAWQTNSIASGALTIEEVDGAPSVAATKLVLPNGTVSVAGAVATYTPSAGSNGSPAGLTGATAATRYVGGTASGAPTSGTFAVGDFVIDQSGKVWICTAAGSPGTWAQAGGSGSGTVGAWHLVGGSGEPAFTNGWSNFGSAAQVARYRLEGDVVRIQGLVKSGSLNTAVFTLPSGFRPPADLYFSHAVDTGGAALLQVNATGVVQGAGSTGWFSLNCTFSITA